MANKTVTKIEPPCLADCTIGKRLLALRERLGLSQRELARRAGIPNASLSQIEQGKVSPTISSMQKILFAAGTTLEAFFSQADVLENPVIAKAQCLTVDDGVAAWELLPPSPARSANFLRVNLMPNGFTYCPWQLKAHTCLGSVMQGTVSLMWVTQNFILEEGDSIQLPSIQFVEIVNKTNQAAKMVWYLS